MALADKFVEWPLTIKRHAFIFGTISRVWDDGKKTMHQAC
jgi:hypothetical protein